MNRFQENKNFLKILTLADKNTLKAIIKGLNKKQTYCLCEIVLNLLKGNIKISKDDFLILKKYKRKFRNLLNKPKLTQKKYILQKGGFLEVLIPTVISTLVTAISELIK